MGTPERGDAVKVFDVTAPLVPDLTGRLFIEASAGTGKTHALSSLVVRYVAEGHVTADQLLVVTFTRAATNELRSRIRQRLIEVADLLELSAGALATDDGPESGDSLVGFLRQGDPDDVRLRSTLLRDAVADFDAMTITTIHGFARQIRSSLGAGSGLDPEATLVENSNEIIDEITSDVLATESVESTSPGASLPTPSKLAGEVRTLTQRPYLGIAPRSGNRASPEAQLMATLVKRARNLMKERRDLDGTVNFSDLLDDVARVLKEPEGAQAVAVVRNRYKVALIDEFQDTDQAQWEIFNHLFGQDAGDHTLVTVGDAKQAIYSFRGADIDTYLTALDATEPSDLLMLQTNWRSSGELLAALEVLMRGSIFGDRRIPFTSVDAAPANEGRRLTTDEGAALPPLSVRVVVDPDLKTSSNGHLYASDVERYVVADVVGHVRHLLDHGRMTEGGESHGGSRLHPSDVAVLTLTRAEAAEIQQALVFQGIPAVTSRPGSVLASDAAFQMRALLLALERPSDRVRARMAALGWFFGRSAEALDAASDADIQQVQDQLAVWAQLFVDHPVAQAFEIIARESRVTEYVLARARGDRNLTDLEHLTEFLHAEVPGGRLKPAGLLALLEKEPAGGEEGDGDQSSDVVSRRVESDTEAVQIMTVFGSKGLEFPVVMVPTLWKFSSGKVPKVFVDPETGEVMLDVWPSEKKDRWPEACPVKEVKHRANQARVRYLGEQMRLLYVAMTRAQVHVAVWWGATRDSGSSALNHLLFGRDPETGAVDAGVMTIPKVGSPQNDRVVSWLAERLGHPVAVTEVAPPPEVPTDPWQPPDEGPLVGGPGDGRTLEVRRFTVSPDRTSFRWSFSALTGDDDHAEVLRAGDERTEGEVVDRENGPDADATQGPQSALALLPAGPEFGETVHAVLEHIDFSADDLDAEVRARIDEQGDSLDLDGGWPGSASTKTGAQLLQEGLVQALRTPLGPPAGDRALTAFTWADRLNEVRFELTLAGDGSPANLSRLATVVADGLDADDPFREWARHLARGDRNVVLAGHLNGSIDLVLRRRRDDGSWVYLVADYKSNRLNRARSAVRSGDYDRAAMAHSMEEHDYPLQALIYSVALHRYLRWRDPAYQPERQLGGALYLYLRGMGGPDTPNGEGVFHWAIPPGLVVQLSDLLEGGEE